MSEAKWCIHALPYWVIIGSDYGLAPDWRQAITRTNVDPQEQSSEKF